MGLLLSKEDRRRVTTLLEMTRSRGGLAKVERSINQGDFADRGEERLARRWLMAERQKERDAWLLTPDGASTRQANAAETANRRSLIAIIISLAALLIAGWDHIGAWLQ